MKPASMVLGSIFLLSLVVAILGIVKAPEIYTIAVLGAYIYLCTGLFFMLGEWIKRSSWGPGPFQWVIIFLWPYYVVRGVA